eukprot:TRINITY_DN10853_c0_g1_i1.p2 TRINITY_DN10853_c0_g1~~TRINITY_DN10853_c0_g1_i1.p2  ORF type:complete len:554 (-),score=154.03 TRINITY_DN10853_c0_g1_i1:3-1571(-)
MPENSERQVAPGAATLEPAEMTVLNCQGTWKHMPSIGTWRNRLPFSLEHIVHDLGAQPEEVSLETGNEDAASLIESRASCKAPTIADFMKVLSADIDSWQQARVPDEENASEASFLESTLGSALGTAALETDALEAAAPETDVSFAGAVEVAEMAVEADVLEADAPEADASEAASPEADASEAARLANASKADAPEADASESAAPEVDALETARLENASEADAPEADASEAARLENASEADAPEAHAPEADAPEADASEAAATETIVSGAAALEATQMSSEAAMPENSSGEQVALKSAALEPTEIVSEATMPDNSLEQVALGAAAQMSVSNCQGEISVPNCREEMSKATVTKAGEMYKTIATAKPAASTVEEELSEHCLQPWLQILRSNSSKGSSSAPELKSLGAEEQKEDTESEDEVDEDESEEQETEEDREERLRLDKEARERINKLARELHSMLRSSVASSSLHSKHGVSRSKASPPASSDAPHGNRECGPELPFSSHRSAGFLRPSRVADLVKYLPCK